MSLTADTQLEGRCSPLAHNPPSPHYVKRKGEWCAGVHLIIDLKEVKRGLDNIEFIKMTLERCVAAANATRLHTHLHLFEGGGVSGVIVLAESHISIHTWPETEYAALDVFMCGKANPHACVPVLEAAFGVQAEVREILRGKQNT